MRNIFMKSYSLTASYQKLATERTVLTATIIASPLNVGVMQIRVDGGTAANWPKGVSNGFAGIDISRIEVKGSAGDSVLVVGTG